MNGRTRTRISKEELRTRVSGQAKTAAKKKPVTLAALKPILSEIDKSKCEVLPT